MFIIKKEIIISLSIKIYSSFEGVSSDTELSQQIFVLINAEIRNKLVKLYGLTDLSKALRYDWSQ